MVGEIFFFSLGVKMMVRKLWENFTLIFSVAKATLEVQIPFFYLLVRPSESKTPLPFRITPIVHGAY